MSKQKSYFLSKLILSFGLVFTMSCAADGTKKKEVKMAKKPEVLKPGEISELYSHFEYEKHQLTVENFAFRMKEKETVVLDLRNSGEFDRGHIKGALNLNLDATEESLAKIIPSKDTVILTYCSNSFFPTRMMSLTSTLVPQIYKLGYKNVYFLEDFTRTMGEHTEKSLKQKLDWVDTIPKK